MKKQQLTIRKNVSLNSINPNEVVNVSLCSFNGNPVLSIITSDAEYLHGITDGFMVMKANNFLYSLKLGCEIAFRNYRQYAELLLRLNRTLEIRSCMKQMQYSGCYTPDDVYDELFGRMTEEQIQNVLPTFFENAIPFIQDALSSLTRAAEKAVAI